MPKGPAVSVLVDPLHPCLVRGFAPEPRGVAEPHFYFGIEPKTLKSTSFNAPDLFPGGLHEGLDPYHFDSKTARPRGFTLTVVGRDE